MVSVTTIDGEAKEGLPTLPKFLLQTLPRYLRLLYNFDGLEVFRKRFKPRHWEEVHLAVWRPARSEMSGNQAWLRALMALGRSFEPRLRLRWSQVTDLVTRPFRRYPLTIALGILAFVPFATVNHFDQLPETTLSRWGFSASAPLLEWIPRSLVSDFLYFDSGHFWVWNTILLLFVAWGERTQRRRFLVPFLAAVSLFDDFLNYAVVIKPFQYFQPHTFSYLVKVKDVGGSLILVTLVGLQICRFRRNREILFTILALGTVLGFTFSSMQIHSLVVNLNHFLFLSLGFVSGKLKFEFDRARSRQMAKGKPPQGRSVIDNSPSLRKARRRREKVAA